MKSTAIKLALLALIFTASPKLFANDSAATIGAGGIQFVKSPVISIESEDLAISKERVKVAYKFKNNSASAITTLVAFPFPPISASSDNDLSRGELARVQLTFEDFEATSNGKKVTITKEMRAALKNRDITELLKNEGMLTLDLEGIDKKLRSLPEEKKNYFLKEKLISDDGKPLWVINIKYYWQQTFIANSITEIEHSYTPHVGGAIGSGPDENGRLLSYGDDCQDEWLKKKLLKVKPGNYSYSQLDYILTTANNWGEDGIKKIHITIKKDEGEIVSTCLTGLKKISPTTFEATYENYAPKADIRIFFYKF